MRLSDRYGKILLLDTETTGKNPMDKETYPVELGMLEVSLGGKIRMYDEYISLPKGKKIPKEITELTGITDADVANGVSWEDAKESFLDFSSGKTLIVAHNAMYDLQILCKLVGGYNEFVARTENCDYLDTLTVYKDRKQAPNKLVNAIEDYNLKDVENSHRAIDDVKVLYKFLLALQHERADLLEYVNLFGYYPGFGRPAGIKRIRTVAQPARKNGVFPLPVSETVYGKIKKENTNEQLSFVV